MFKCDYNLSISYSCECLFENENRTEWGPTELPPIESGFPCWLGSSGLDAVISVALEV
jgi:hypothetical protein